MQGSSLISSNDRQLVTVNSKFIASKMSNKREIYRFLQSEVRCFLDDYDVMTIYHLRDLFNNDRHRIHCDDVKVYQAPQYDGLSIADMLKFAQGYQLVQNALPKEQIDIQSLHRNYVSTVIFTLVGDPFHQWVQQRINMRNQKLEANNDMMVHMDPEIAELLNKSTNVSNQKGISYSLLKKSAKRRRSKAQIAEDKQREKMQKTEVQQRLMELNSMQKEMDELKQQLAVAESMRQQVQTMFDNGILTQDQHGNFSAVVDPNESEQIRSQVAEASKAKQNINIDLNQINSQLDEMAD